MRALLSARQHTLCSTPGGGLLCSQLCSRCTCLLLTPSTGCFLRLQGKGEIKEAQDELLEQKGSIFTAEGSLHYCPGRTQPSSDTKPAQQRSNTLLSPVGFCSPRQLQMLSESGLWTFGWHRLRTCRRTRMLWNGKGIQRDF